MADSWYRQGGIDDFGLGRIKFFWGENLGSAGLLILANLIGLVAYSDFISWMIDFDELMRQRHKNSFAVAFSTTHWNFYWLPCISFKIYHPRKSVLF
jgi:hypothetical protein